MPNPIRAAIYLRLSRDAEDSTSIASQEQDCRDFCRLRGWEVVQVASDVDVSGSIRPEDRTGFREILDNLSGVDVVVARSVDRFSRVTAHFAGLVESLTSNGATLADVHGQVDLTSPYGKFVTTIMVAFAEMERETIKARILRSRGELRRQGRWLGGAAPYGFRLVDKDGGKALDLDKYAQDVLAEVIQRVIKGVTLSQEIDRLNSSGEASPGTYRKITRGEWHPPMVWEEWTYSALYQLLRSEVLRGYRVVGKRSERRAVRDEFGAPVMVGPALTDDETWYALQDALDQAGQTNRRPRRKATLLLHVAWCPNCDETLYYNSREYKGKRLDLYTCEAARYKRVREQGRCSGISVNAARLEKQVEEWLLTRFGRMAFKVQRRVGGGSDRRVKLDGLRADIDALAADLAGLRGASRAAVLRQLEARQEALEEIEAEPDVPERWEWVPTGRTVAEEWEARDTAERRLLLLDFQLRATVAPANGRRAWDPERVHVGRYVEDPEAERLEEIAREELE